MNAISARKKETIEENAEESWDIKEKLPSAPVQHMSRKQETEC